MVLFTSIRGNSYDHRSIIVLTKQPESLETQSLIVLGVTLHT